MRNYMRGIRALVSYIALIHLSPEGVLPPQTWLSPGPLRSPRVLLPAAQRRCVLAAGGESERERESEREALLD